ncbi:MAG: DUF1294 domain-containing protein [Clostridia bacterium]|nr:DUF1294 domain-containing protein [Clostridia bacterium]
MEHLPLYIFLSVSLVSVILTVYDKIAAKRLPRHRVPESTLLMLSILGGSLPMYITMQIVHHKTQHKKFMIGIPIILAVQIILMILYFYFIK